MRLKNIYDICVAAGIEADARDRAEIDRVLAEYRKAFDKLDEDEKEFFDAEKLVNPYSDTRICVGDPEAEIRGLLVGIDMEVGEVLLADRLREKGAADRPGLRPPPRGPRLREPPRGHVHAGRPLGRPGSLDRRG